MARGRLWTSGAAQAALVPDVGGVDELDDADEVEELDELEPESDDEDAAGVLLEGDAADESEPPELELPDPLAEEERLSVR
ncbi:hypothetical protein CLV35_3694 [Motilibacter peucedani]|uniref:Uncharacterized protein n=1 Tax=Motilibacter peucedani TaxID=598650 RepID=A0A420XKL5_9ACTN|nr:hypothetical protein [Motilibacter peucedani]RKS68566.1 hypothetical protein CLV35_3694 [Motilibacter peucedani]